MFRFPVLKGANTSLVIVINSKNLVYYTNLLKVL